MGVVGDSGVTNDVPATASGQNYAGAGLDSALGTISGSYPDPQMSTAFNYQGAGPGSGYSQAQDYQGSPAGSQAYGYTAPQATGPYQERLSPDDLRLSMPQAESFQPDSNKNFAAATLPSSLSVEGYSTTQTKATWYYPEFSSSNNRFYAQTSSGLTTTAACSAGGYLPLWADVKSAGNLYVYEWYPNQQTPYITWGGWNWQGWKKGWFGGDSPGWHILCYNCRDWSNYVYIYVYPANAYANSYGNTYGNAPGSYGSAYGSAYGTTYGTTSGYGATYGSGYGSGSTGPVTSGLVASHLPSGAPTPPNIDSEKLVFPDYTLIAPSSTTYQSSALYYSLAGMSGASGYSTAGSCPGCNAQGQYFAASGGSTGSSSAGYPTAWTAQGAAQGSCTACATAASGNQVSGCTGQGNCQTCAVQGFTAQPAQVVQTYQTVFPGPSTYKCNEYYLQNWQDNLCTVGSARCNEWLPLWSKISQPGNYWSFEWTMCGSNAFCSPEVKNFGCKGAGWHMTWFRGNKPGWYVLSYHCNDWSNYVYIYVWPST
ncbi:MAG: hypothetical protein HPY61_08050 [Methanotrichaceae archaeon]|nr:hypothetical protein [Methanotrichaceae archaeon]